MDPDDLEFLIDNSQRWIAAQRSLYRPTSEPLPDAFRALLELHFLPETLSAARLTRVHRIENPDFYAQLDQIPLDFRSMAGITYDDTILVSDSSVRGPIPISLLVHELVHVVQYSILGIEEFAKQYVTGWAQNGFDYYKIPLEIQAYALQRKFERHDLSTGPVEHRIRQELAI
jgi:hypothetical protein